MKVTIKKSHIPEKKYDAVFNDDGHLKTIPFGASGYSDYTMHHDEARKTRYINRHKSNENFNNPMTAGALSRWILWEKPTIKEGIKAFKNKFNLEIV
jgi:hypothetical protein